MAIKEIKEKNGKIKYVVDGINFATRELAETYIKSPDGDDKEKMENEDALNTDPEFVFDPVQKNQSFKKFLCAKILEKKISITGLSKELGVTRKALYAWMSGESMPEKARIDKICEILEVKPREVWIALSDNMIMQNKEFFASMMIFDTADSGSNTKAISIILEGDLVESLRAVTIRLSNYPDKKKA